jgi:putative ABC transport system substrate-binding protein
MIRRRSFLTLLAGAAAWPLGARAQQSERIRRIGVLMNLAADDSEGQARIMAFVRGLQQSGWTNGHNARIDIRWAPGDAARFQRAAEELLALAPDVILASATPSVRALQQATRTVMRDGAPGVATITCSAYFGDRSFQEVKVHKCP